MGGILMSWPIVVAQIPHALTVGDTLPANLFRMVREKIPDSTQAVIIDFMTSSCSSCILAFPYEQELEDRSGGKVRFLVVTPEAEQVFYKGIRKTAIGRALRAPVLTGDSLLRARFPFHTVSHLVWLNNKGVVQAITGAERLTEASISSLAKGLPLRLPVKTDHPFTFEKKPFVLGFLPGQLPYDAAPAAFNYSFFSTYIDGRSNGISSFRDTVDNMVSFKMTNSTLFFLYRAAFNLKANAKCRWLIPDSARYAYFEDQEDIPEFVWRPLHTYCYQAFFPESMPLPARLERIRTDLAYYTGISARLAEEGGVPVVELYRPSHQTAGLAPDPDDKGSTHPAR